MDKPDDAMAAYCAFLAALSPETLGSLDVFCSPEVRFRDPFNDVTGVAPFRAILKKAFDDLHEPRFAVLHHGCAGQVGYMRWDFTFQGRRGPRLIAGMSEIRFDDALKVAVHFDYWDPSQIYASVPLLGMAVRLVRRRLGLPAASERGR